MKPEQRDTRLVQTGDRIGLKFEGGWWFLQAVGTEYVEMKPWTLQNASGNRAAIAAKSAGSDADNIEDSNQNKILEPEKNHRDTVNQILWGVAPSRMQVFTLFGRNRNTSLQNYDKPGDPAAFVDGYDSPYDDPSPVTETFYVNAMSPLRLQAYNPMDTAHEAKVSFHVNKIRYNTITDESLMKAMLQGQVPARLIMMGQGVAQADQLQAPDWVTEAFGSDIYTTSQILSYQSGGSNQSNTLSAQSGANVQNILAGGVGTSSNSGSQGTGGSG